LLKDDEGSIAHVSTGCLGHSHNCGGWCSSCGPKVEIDWVEVKKVVEIRVQRYVRAAISKIHITV
jgi:hypothetical protein